MKQASRTQKPKKCRQRRKRKRVKVIFDQEELKLREPYQKVTNALDQVYKAQKLKNAEYLKNSVQDILTQ